MKFQSLIDRKGHGFEGQLSLGLGGSNNTSVQGCNEDRSSTWHLVRAQQKCLISWRSRLPGVLETLWSNVLISLKLKKQAERGEASAQVAQWVRAKLVPNSGWDPQPHPPTSYFKLPGPAPRGAGRRAETQMTSLSEPGLGDRILRSSLCSAAMPWALMARLYD